MSYQSPITIKQAIHKLDHSEYLLPAIQREFVWNSEEIELLFDSLMRNYPIGSFLVWKVSGLNKIDYRYYSILKRYREKYQTHCDEISTANLADFEAVLDGQQRLTALYLGLKGSYAFKRKNRAWKNNEYSIPTRKLYLCLNENSIDEENNDDGRIYDFRFLTTEECLESELLWFEVKEILYIQNTFDLDKLFAKRKWNNIPFITETLSNLYNVIHVKPIINCYLELDQDYDKALKIFIRTNNGGQKLTYSDLIMSTIIAGWTSYSMSARDEFTNLIDEIWHSTAIQIDKDLIIRTYLLIFSEDIKFRITNFNLKNALEFKENWSDIRNAITECIELISDFGYVERTITSKNALLPIIHYLFISKRTTQFSIKTIYKVDRAIIKKFFHTVLLKKIFGGQADNILKAIRDIVKKEVSNGASTFPLEQIASSLSKTRKTLTFSNDDLDRLLETTYEDRYAFSILAILYPHLDYKNNDFNKDHIFPKSQFTPKYLKKANINISGEKGNYYTANWCNNGIVNLQMLDSNDNKSKSGKSFEKWVDSCDVNFKKQLLPKHFKLEEFPTFVDKCWDILKQKLAAELNLQ